MKIEEICKHLGLDPDTVSDADKELLLKSYGAVEGDEPEKATQGLVKRLLNALLKSPKKLGEVLKAMDDDVTLDDDEPIDDDEDLDDEDLDLDDEDAEEYEKAVDEDDLEGNDDDEENEDDVSDAEVAEALKRMELEKEGAPETGKIKKALLRDPEMEKIMDADEVVSEVMKSAGAAFEALSESVMTELGTLRKQVAALRKAVDGMGSTPAQMASPTALVQKSAPGGGVSKEEAAIRKNVFDAQEKRLTDEVTAINILKSVGTANWDNVAKTYEELVKRLQA